jgi:hypothetical protein
VREPVLHEQQQLPLAYWSSSDYRETTIISVLDFVASHTHIPQNEVGLVAGNCDIGSVISLSFDIMADSTNIDHKVRTGSSFDCISKATVVSAFDVLASRGVVDLNQKLPL